MTAATDKPPAVDAVDSVPPPGRTVTLGLQHVLVMYAGAVTVPLIVGGALRLPPAQIAQLISADLLCCGLVSLLQTLGVGRHIGIRLPVMMGISYAGIGPMIAIGLNPELGLPGLYGSIIAAGLICLLLVPWMVRLIRLFPPLVTGTALLTLGVSLLGVAVTWAGGGFGVANFGSPYYLGVATLVILVILIVNRCSKGFLANVAVLIGILSGTLVAMALGKVDFTDVAIAPWFEIVRPLQFGKPKFDAIAILTMTLVVLITMVESVGLFFSLAEIVERKLQPDDFKRGLRADALGASIGGIFNTFPYTSYAQNIGLVGITGVRSRFVCATASMILLALALFPKMAYIVASIPHYVLGGAAIAMFGMVAASGLRLLQSVDFRTRRHNTLIFAISLGVGMIPTLSPKFFDALPASLAPLLSSSVLLAIITAATLNFAFNGLAAQQPHRETQEMPTPD